MTWSFSDPDLVQHVSLPLEIMGMFLVFIEIYRPHLAEHIEGILDLYSGFTRKDVLFTEVARRRTRSKYIFSLLIVLAAYLPIIGVLVVAAYNGTLEHLTSFIELMVVATFSLGIGEIPRMLARDIGKPDLEKAGTVVILATVVHGLVVYPVALAFKSLNIIGRGKAVGALGLLLSGIGFIGEIFQVIMLERNPDAHITNKVILIYWLVVVGVLFGLGLILHFVHRDHARIKREDSDKGS